MMKKLYSILPVALLSIYIVSCTTIDVQKNTEIAINPERGQTDIMWSDCAEVDLFQSDSLPLIGSIDKVICSNNHFLIGSQGKLLLFEQTGAFVRQIGRTGRAANEYIGYTDCWVQNEHVYLYDMNGKKVLKYTFGNQLAETFPLLETVAPDTRPFAFCVPFGDGYLGRCVWNGMAKNGSPALALYNADFSFNRIIGDLVIRDGLRLGYPLVRTHDGALYWNPLGRTIYRITQEGVIEPAYTISFGDKNYPDLASVKDDYEILDLCDDKAWVKKHAGFIACAWETNQNLMFTYVYNECLHLVVYDKQKDKMQNYRFPDVARTNILSCAYNDGKIHFFVEKQETVSVYSMSIGKYSVGQ